MNSHDDVFINQLSHCLKEVGAKIFLCVEVSFSNHHLRKARRWHENNLLFKKHNDANSLLNDLFLG